MIGKRKRPNQNRQEREDRALDRLLAALARRPDLEPPSREYWDNFWPRLRPKLLSSDRAAARFGLPPLRRAWRPVPAAAGVLLLIAAAIVFYHQPFGSESPLDPDPPRAAVRQPGSGEVSYVIIRAGDPSEPAREEPRPGGDTLAGTERWTEGDYFIVPARPDRELQRSRHVLTPAGAGAGRLAAW